jgi:uncharacterized protein YcaQ
LELGVRALGICQPLQAADYTYRKRNSVRGILKEMVEEGKFIQVKVRLIDDTIQPYIIHYRDRDLLEKAADGEILPQRTIFLSPFDNLFWARGRDQQFWSFRNLLEAYKPAPTRIWGYFNMPILHKDNLIGRIDPKIDRKNARMIVRSMFIEEGVDLHDRLIADLAQAFRSFMQFHNAKDIIFENKKDREVADRVMAAL